MLVTRPGDGARFKTIGVSIGVELTKDRDSDSPATPAPTEQPNVPFGRIPYPSPRICTYYPIWFVWGPARHAWATP
eukprot:2578830-Pyramimonas_sp.AAC.1